MCLKHIVKIKVEFDLKKQNKNVIFFVCTNRCLLQIQKRTKDQIRHKSSIFFYFFLVFCHLLLKILKSPKDKLEKQVTEILALYGNEPPQPKINIFIL